MASVKNIPLKDFRKFLESVGCERRRVTGGHEIWGRPGLLRPIVIQTHEDPIPIHVVRSNLRTLGMSIEDLLEFLGR